MKRLLTFLAVASIFVSFYFFNLSQYIELQYIQNNLAAIKNFQEENFWVFGILYFFFYVVITALSLPAATIFTLLAGALFGFWKGVILVSFASTTGASIAFLLSRFLFRKSIENRYRKSLKRIDQGIKKDGLFYLFTLRLIPAVPFFVINLTMGLTQMKTYSFYIISQIGMLPGTMVYVNAGLQLAKIKSLNDILSLELIFSFGLLGLFPLIAKKLISFVKKKKVYRNYKKPKSFDYNMITIGAGAAGLVTSYISAAVKAKCALIEKHKMGGDCLNTGCVPSKALLKTAKINYLSQSYSQYGFSNIKTEFNFQKIMERVQKVIKKIEPHDSIERYTKLGVDCIQGSAKIVSPWEVEVNGKTLTTKNITIASGAKPFLPPIKGLHDVPYITSDTLWDLKELPQNLLIIGGGPIGIETAQAFCRLGSKVTLVEMGPQIMSKEDKDTSQYILQRLSHEGIVFKLNTELSQFKLKDNKACGVLKNKNGISEVFFDRVLIAIGRKANTQGLGLTELGIELNSNGTIHVNEYLQTKYPNIFACGDVAGPYQLTHMASHQAWFCAVNGLFGNFKKFKVDYSSVPWATYTDPEVATVGYTETQAKNEKISHDVTKYGLKDLDRAITEESDYGFVKVLTKKGSDQILGATIVGSEASTMILEFVTAIKYKIGLNKILGTIHSYPSMGEANKYVAGKWKENSTSPKIYPWLEKFHRWRRS